MRNSKKAWLFIFIGVLLAVLLMFVMSKNSPEDVIDGNNTNQSITSAVDKPTYAEKTETPTDKSEENNTSAALTTMNEEASAIMEEAASATAEEPVTASEAAETSSENDDTQYAFRSSKLLNQHYQKHGIDMGFSSAEEYEKAAGEVIKNPNSLHKLEAEDGDDIYYLEETNEFVVVSTDGYIRTYFNPDRGIDYYNRQ